MRVSDKTPGDAPAQAGLSIAEASAAIGLSKITVLRRMQNGSWPGGRVGAKWLVSQPFVDALVTAITTGPQVDADAFAVEWMRAASAPAEAVA